MFNFSVYDWMSRKYLHEFSLLKIFLYHCIIICVEVCQSMYVDCIQMLRNVIKRIFDILKAWWGVLSAFNFRLNLMEVEF